MGCGFSSQHPQVRCISRKSDAQASTWCTHVHAGKVCTRIKIQKSLKNFGGGQEFTVSPRLSWNLLQSSRQPTGGPPASSFSEYWDYKDELSHQLSSNSYFYFLRGSRQRDSEELCDRGRKNRFRDSRKGHQPPLYLI